MRTRLWTPLLFISRSKLLTSNVERKLTTSARSWTNWQSFQCHSHLMQHHRVPGPVGVWLNTSMPRQPIHTAAPSSLLSSRRGEMSNLEDARQFVASLTTTQRSSLEEAMKELKIDDEGKDCKAPTWLQLRLLCYQHALPFIGFGFLDNVIMITVGEYIDSTLGIVLGISTMAAAGLGNMISDLAGLGLADRVEALCTALGIPNPNLSSSQLRQRASRLSALFGRCIGIIIGCTIGMAPLMFFDDPHKKHVEDE